MSAQHSLRFGFAVPGAQRGPDGLWHLRWTGTAVMGILNVTPDSFSDGGRHARLDAALASARAMRDAGALMLDVGGESTRPGSEPVPAHEELDRVLPLIRALRGEGVVISVDTMKPEVAQAALEAGAHLINDVTGLRDPQMVAVCAQARAPVCLMHMQGEPRTMQLAPHYDDVVTEVHTYLRDGAARVMAAGVPDANLLPLSTSDVMSRVSASRETVTRVLRRMEQQGLLKMTSAGVRLLEPQGLEDLSLEGDDAE